LAAIFDGVLAKFEAGYAPLLTEESGIGFPRIDDPTWPTCWYWELEAGVTKEQRSKVWEKIKASENFWEFLPAHKGAFEFLLALNEMKWKTDIYFITYRPGNLARFQTECWLEEHGFYRPTVIVSAKKGQICDALGITHYIDDKNEYCEDVWNNSPGTKGYMLARPWNKEVRNVPRLADLTVFLDIIKNDLKLEERNA
jgi:hypothetical protein